mmetsp:Transcript_4124/g.8553  ORF Transcript_4124/g.8553 Transcript_4124/m.8553 type:complete len:712 (-) Transcript_4124:251-2386(-)
MAPSPALHNPTSYNSPSPNGNAYRSTPDSRSSVLSRAREYARRVEDDAKRSKSLDRKSNQSYSKHGYSNPINVSSPTPQKSYRTASPSPGLSSPAYGTTRGRQINVRNSTNSASGSSHYNSNNNSYRSRSNSIGRQSNGGSAHSRGESPYHRRLSIKERALASVESRNKIASPVNNTSYRSSTGSNHIQQRQQSQARPRSYRSQSPSHQNDSSNHSRRVSPARSVRDRARSLSRGRRSSTGEDQQIMQQQQQPEPAQGEAIVSPELLVDALSGHEDGLLAIAERLMEHYDSGYDAMGEAIIDAFADVQKLFQHVVEAAHMEGAAFESSRREGEIRELKEKASRGELDGDDFNGGNDPTSPSSQGPVRHDEFIDQDVKDCLNDAIRKGIAFKEENRHADCFELYEQACQAASAMLPVDSDHRGRLQLSIARAESMSPDRGCAILRYAMDDVLRSGLRAGKIPKNYSMDHSKRADVVLSKPSKGVTPQSSEEELNALIDEMKEIINAPIYEDTPLQNVAKRFWNALHENHKLRSKNEDRLEHNLGKLKGDYLLARAEWEEKLTQAKEEAELYKRKYNTVKDGKEVSLMEDARSMMSQRFSQSLSMNDSSNDLQNDADLKNSSFRSATSRPEFKRATESVASLGSNLAAHAKTLVGSFACADENKAAQYVASERATEEWRGRRSAMNENEENTPGLEISRSGSRSYRDTRRVDV